MRIAITGASRGIGHGLAEAWRAEGHEVIGTSRRDGEGLVALDVADADGFGAFRAALGDAPLDLLVCNAGIFPDRHEALGKGYPAAMWADVFATNVTGAFLTVEAALPALRRAASPKIALISSRMGSQALNSGGSYIYRASKAALLNLGRSLAQDLAGEGIAVGIYHPGWVRTDMGGAAAAIDVGTSVEGLLRRFAELSPATSGGFLAHDGEALPF